MDQPQGKANLRDLLDRASARLKEAGVENSRHEARALMSAMFDTTHAHLLAHPEEHVTLEDCLRFESAVERRSRREPFAYIVGHREFYGLDFEVSTEVLIPRPETELLVECAIEAARDLRSKHPRDLLAVDLGTGSGAVAVAVAANTSNLRVVAVDCSAGTLEVARRNARRNGVEDRVEFRLGDLLDGIEGRIDLLLANLPYIPAAEIDALMPEVAAYEPRSALDGGEDGTVIVRRALADAAGRKDPPQVLLFEIGDGQGGLLEKYSKSLFPEARVAVHRDHAGLERLLAVWNLKERDANG